MALPALGAFVLQILLLTCDVHAQGSYTCSGFPMRVGDFMQLYCAL